MIKVRTRSKILLFASALSPLSVLIFITEVKLNLTAYSPPSRGFVLFNVPYQDLLEGLFLAGILAFILSIFSIARDNRSRTGIPWLNQ
jgi:uncharacterized membrane protein YagU involved in acid resistance